MHTMPSPLVIGPTLLCRDASVCMCVHLPEIDVYVRSSDSSTDTAPETPVSQTDYAASSPEASNLSSAMQEEEQPASDEGLEVRASRIYAYMCLRESVCPCPRA
jgi:hypothetical protein